jgi:3D (Asp-Asp-Asp) domain-containing protein
MESAISLMVLIGMIVTTAVPQTVAASTGDLGAVAVSGVVQTTAAVHAKSAYDGVTFPTAGKRDARRIMYVVATAYSSEAAQTDDTPCMPAMWGFDLCVYYENYGIADTIASNDLPLGTQVRFPELHGDKVFTVRDRMNKRYTGKSRIDFWLTEKSEAIQFGVKRIKMEIL